MEEEDDKIFEFIMEEGREPAAIKRPKNVCYLGSPEDYFEKAEKAESHVIKS